MIVRFCYAVYLQLLNQHNQEFRPYTCTHQTLFSTEQGRVALGTRLHQDITHHHSLDILKVGEDVHMSETVNGYKR